MLVLVWWLQRLVLISQWMLFTNFVEYVHYSNPPPPPPPPPPPLPRCAMSDLIADSRTMVDRARVDAQNHWIVYNEPMSVESVTQSVSNLAMMFGEDDDEKTMVRGCVISEEVDISRDIMWLQTMVMWAHVTIQSCSKWCSSTTTFDVASKMLHFDLLHSTSD